MGLQSNLLRRGATYAWRKRLPVNLGDGLIQISLRTNDPKIARRVAAVVSAESTHIFDIMKNHALSKPDARRLLTAVIDRELARISLARTVSLDDPSPFAWQNDRLHDWAMGQALQMLAERGVSAENLTEQDRQTFQEEGKTYDDIERLETALGTEAQAFRHPPSKGPNARVKRAMEAALERSDFTHMEYLEGRKIYMNGRGASLLTALGGDSDTTVAMDMAERLNRSEQEPTAQINLFPQEPETSPSAKPPETIPTKQMARSYDPKMASLVTRLMDQKRRQNMSVQMIEQMEKTLGLFVEFCEIETINDLQQMHVAQYVDMLHELPKHYRRSPKTRHMSLKRILKAAKAGGKKPEGLSVTTINRNLDYLGQVLKKARAEGFISPIHIDLDALRLRKQSRERDECPPFTHDDVQNVFRHPVWHGAVSKRDWQSPGLQLVRDGLFWIPATAALTGARRAEIAGLQLQDVAILDGIPALRLRENSNRSIKTFGSERDVPLHPQLLELGLMDYAEQLRADGGTDLFPDMKLGIGTKDKWGGKIDYRFRQVLDNRLTEGRGGKSFKSFRHYVITQLGRSKSVAENVRKDIVGHVGGSMTAERYTDTATLPEKLDALRMLPRLPFTHCPDRA